MMITSLPRRRVIIRNNVVVSCPCRKHPAYPGCPLTPWRLATLPDGTRRWWRVFGAAGTVNGPRIPRSERNADA